MLEPGLEATVEERVTEAMTADALGSGDVPVLGTPAVLALAERAACAAIDGRLDEDETSVGSAVELAHLAPTPLGATITARARLTTVDGRTLSFDVSVWNGSGEVARGTHHRVIVRREDFLQAARAR
jgi:predicted thioesterase